MCTIDKMLIKGIRSFSPDNTTVISFFKPLTLIVGPNGAGKTTIIECLKNATTGELPPNSRAGQTFIFDPKIAGETETKGQIKLRFRTAAGKDVVCIRSFQLTQKATKMEYKALESVLQTVSLQTGERVSLSYRCADMDREVPLLMGVSKAILENVIFVHQDDANWPLAEPAALKKRFDDIFSSTRYTKALDVLKKLHKDQAQLIKEMKLKLEHLRTLKDSAHRLHKGIESDEQRIEKLSLQIRELQGRVAKRQAQQKEVEGVLAKLRRLGEEMRVKEGRREVLQRQKEQQYNDIEIEVEESDEDLIKWQQNFESSVASLRSNMAAAERSLSDARAQSEADKQRYSEAVKMQGRLQAEAEANAVDCKDRDTRLQSFISRHGLGSVGPLPLAHDAAVRHTSEAGEAVKLTQGKLAQLKEGHKSEEARLTAAVEAAASEVLKAEGQLKVQTERKRDSESRLQQLRASMDSSRVSDEELRRCEERERGAKEEAERLASRIREGQYEGRMEDARTALFGCEQKVKALQREKDTLAAESGDRVTLRLKKEMVQDREAGISKLLSENNSKLRELFPDQVPDARQLHEDIERVIKARKVSYEKLDEDSKTAGNELAALDMRLADSKRELARRSSEREGKKAALLSALQRVGQEATAGQVATEAGVPAVDKVYEAAAEDAAKKKSDFDMAVGISKLVEKFEAAARSQHACPVCYRGFTAPEEEKFVADQRQRSSTAGSGLRQVEEGVRAAQRKADLLAELQPLYRDYCKLANEVVPRAQAAVEEAESAHAKASERHDELLGSLVECKANLDSLSRLELVTREVARSAKEVTGIKQELEDLEVRLDTMSQGLRSMADVSAELAGAEEKREEWQRKLESLREEQQAAKDAAMASNLKWRNARDDRQGMSQRQARQREVEREMSSVGTSIEEMQLQIQIAERSLTPLRREQVKRSEERSAWREKALKEEEEAVGRLRAMERDMDGIRSVAAKINQYALTRKSEQLSEVSVRVQELEARQREMEGRLKELQDAVTADGEKLRNQATIKRNIDDNANYRATAREEAAVAAEVAALRSEMAGLGDVAALQAQMRSVTEEIQEMMGEQNRGQGTVSAHEASIARNRQELRQAQYKDVEARYRNQLIQLKTTEMAAKDLDKYCTALDRALLRFHALKMEEINRIVKELWQQTYRGQDIDYIELRADNEGAGARSYSYRVVMHSGDAELEMRGRCSAGQKVLASLVIRLALAETFCLNCGILALDEPTTNLDEPNAESLATALLRIMEERKGQENFQLIVITHDERFAQMIGQKQHADRYYRISKNDSQRSKIEVQNIFD